MHSHLNIKYVSDVRFTAIFSFLSVLQLDLDNEVLQNNCLYLQKAYLIKANPQASYRKLLLTGIYFLLLLY
jgi:hypothetical protein